MGERRLAIEPGKGRQGQGWSLICQFRLLDRLMLLRYLTGSLDTAISLWYKG